MALKVSSLLLQRSFSTIHCDHGIYPDLDAWAGGGTQPVTVGAEAQGIDGVSTVQGVQVLALVQVPQHGLAVLGGRENKYA